MREGSRSALISTFKNNWSSFLSFILFEEHTSDARSQAIHVHIARVEKKTEKILSYIKIKYVDT